MAQDVAGGDGEYIDAGSIVAGAVALPIWAKQFGFGSDFVSLLGAMSSNAISAGIGALVGGRVPICSGSIAIYPVDLCCGGGGGGVVGGGEGGGGEGGWEEGKEEGE